MKPPSGPLIALGLSIASMLLPARLVAAPESDQVGSGTYRGRILSDRFMREQRLARQPQLAALSETANPPRQDIGEIAIVDTSNGVVADPNVFDLAGDSVLFTPGPDGFTVTSGRQTPRLDAIEAGLPLALDDDDVREVRLPFSFPYFGAERDVLFVHSDGDLTFEQPDARSVARNFSRAFGGPPRIVPLFSDLDPSAGGVVSVYSLSDQTVISWQTVPTFQRFGVGPRQSFQAILHADGRIEFIYATVNVANAVVGLFPGRLAGTPTPVDMSVGSAGPVPAAAAEIFTNTRSLDCFAASQAFYRNHDDSYDFVIFFNDFNLSPGPGSFAFEVNVRNQVLGIGDLLFSDPVFDFGVDFGSERRLSSFLNMGPTASYPDNPAGRIPILGENTTLSVLGQEVGHRFLAYPEFIDPATGLRSQRLLGRQQAHWSFFLNSEASVVEGNAIEDNGPGVSPRFLTTGAVSRYSQLDQYLMGFRSPEETGVTFLVENPRNGIGFSNPSRAPQTGVSFDGDRKDISVEQIAAAEGPRLPASTVAQRDFRFAFILLVREGTEPNPAALARVERIRQEWLPFFEAASDGRATGRAGLVELLHLSTWPAGGVVVGNPGQARVEIARPRATDLTVNLTADGILAVPATVVIPAGDTSAQFALDGAAAGVTTLTAEAAEPGFDRAVSRVEVRDSFADLTIEPVSGDGQVGAISTPLAEPVVFRLIDANLAPYSGVAVRFDSTPDGLLSTFEGVTDSGGRVEVQWTLPASEGLQVLTARLRDDPSVTATVTAQATISGPVFSSVSVGNSASYQTAEAPENGFAAGSLITIFGAGLAGEAQAAQRFPLPDELAGTRVLVNGVATPLLFVSPTQINLQLAFELSGATFTLTVITPGGASDVITLSLGPAQPGIFNDAAGNGAIVNADGTLVSVVGAAAGSTVQVFATGLGAVTPSGRTALAALASPLSEMVLPIEVLVDGQPIVVTFGGLAPFSAGLYQVNIELPADLLPGRHSLVFVVDGTAGNEVFFNSN